MHIKYDLVTLVKRMFKPKVGSARWFNSFPKMTTHELKEIREKFWQALFDPKESSDYRTRIREIILPHIDDILRERKDV